MKKTDPKPVPQSSEELTIQAEREYLGSVLIDNKLFHATPPVPPECFNLSFHRVIAAEVTRMIAAGQEANLFTIKTSLTKAGVLKQGDVAALSDLTSCRVARPASVMEAARMIREGYRRRRFEILLDQAAARRFDSTVALDDTIGELQRALAEVDRTDDQTTDRSGSEALENVVSEVAQRHAAGKTIEGLTFGIPTIDRATGGQRAGEVTILAGCTGSGKTAFATSMVSAVLQDGIPVGYLSLEMSGEELLERMLSSASGIDYQLIHTEPSSLSTAELETLNATRKRMKPWTDLLHIDDRSHTLNSVLLSARRMILRHRVQLLVLDHMHLVLTEERDLRLRLTQVSGALRELAKDTRVPLLALSQLARTKLPNEPPTIFELKESGSLEQDAHRVLLLHRPLNSGHYTHEDVIVIGKQRAGRTGREDVYFNQNLVRWEERPKKGL